MGRRQALGWLGATLCSVALIVAGGLVLSSIAVNRYLQASTSVMHRGDASDVGPTPAPAELASIDHVVANVNGMPGVATASCAIETATPSPASPAPSTAPTATSTGSATFSYNVSVIMNPSATPGQAADVVFSMTKQLQNSRVNLELSSPAGDGHAASVVDYRHAFDAPVEHSTVAAVSQAVAAATAVPGVKSVQVTVPYTWNLASGDLNVAFAAPDTHQTEALKDALKRTALSGVEWSTSH